MPFERLNDEQREELESEVRKIWAAGENEISAQVLELLRDYKIIKEAYDNSSDRYVRLQVYLIKTFNVDIRNYNDMRDIEKFGEDLMRGVFRVMKKKLFGEGFLL